MGAHRKPGEKFEVYGYQGNQDIPEILNKGTYAAAYEVLNRGAIILAFRDGLGWNNYGDVFLLPPFMMRE